MRLIKHLNAKTFANIILLTFIISIIFTVIRIIIAPTVAPSSGTVVRVKSDYIFMLLECILGAVALLIPIFLRRIIRLSIPSFMLTTYAVFLFCAIYLGEVSSFYYLIPHWDTILHTFSGVALGALGFSLTSLMNKSESVTFTLSPVFLALFSFCFALSFGVIWEIYEFSIDHIFLTNSQKFTTETGEWLVGHMALADTMKDLIVDAIGALAMSIIGFISLKYEKGWLERLKFKVQ